MTSILISRDPVRMAEARAAELARHKAEAIALIASRSAAARAAYITPIPGQEMIYLAKESEAVSWTAAMAPDLADYPMIAGEIGITGDTADQIAQIWLNMGALWRGIAAQLEPARLAAEAAIQAATSVEAITAITDSFTLENDQ